MDVVKRDLYGGRILMAIFLTVFLFFLVFYFVGEIMNKKAISINEDHQQLQEEIVLENLNLEGNLDCESAKLVNLSKKLDQVGSYLAIIENKKGKEFASILPEKKQYTSLEIQHMLLSKKINELCDDEKLVILYFYSNGEETLEEAELVGYMLDNVKKNNPNYLIYSFDYDLEFSLISALKKIYGVDLPNTLVIGEKKLVSPKNVNDIYNFIKN